MWCTVEICTIQTHPRCNRPIKRFSLFRLWLFHIIISFNTFPSSISFTCSSKRNNGPLPFQPARTDFPYFRSSKIYVLIRYVLIFLSILYENNNSIELRTILVTRTKFWLLKRRKRKNLTNINFHYIKVLFVISERFTQRLRDE